MLAKRALVDVMLAADGTRMVGSPPLAKVALVQARTTRGCGWLVGAVQFGAAWRTAAAGMDGVAKCRGNCKKANYLGNGHKSGREEGDLRGSAGSAVEADGGGVFSLCTFFMWSISASVPRKSLWHTGHDVALGPPMSAACCCKTPRCSCSSCVMCVGCVIVMDGEQATGAAGVSATERETKPKELVTCLSWACWVCYSPWMCVCAGSIL